MAHSIQSLGNKAKIFNDGDLMVLILLLEQEVSEHPSRYPVIGHIVTRWKQELPSCGPGLIDLKLANTALPIEVRQEFITLLDAVSKILNSFGEKIPGSYLNQVNNVPDVKYFDYDASRAKSVMSEFLDLLSD